MHNHVHRIVATKSFERAIKVLKNQHKAKELDEIYSVVQKLASFEITKQKSNHPLTGAKGHKDIHISGGRLILLYRYDEVSVHGSTESIVYVDIDLRLQDIVNHTQLKRYAKYNSSAYDYDPENIKSSCDTCNRLTHIAFYHWYNQLSEELQWDVEDLADELALPDYPDCTEFELYQLKYQYELTDHKGTWRGLLYL